MERRGAEHGGSRPGSMTMAMRAVGADSGARAEVVRLGVVLGDGRLEERSVPLEGPVVVGAHAEASVVLPGLARPYVLFTRTGETIRLHVTAAMRARVVLAGHTREISGRDEDVVLDGRARGKLTIGASTLLFQLAPAPPARPRPALPTAVRPSLFAHLDMAFTALVAVSFLGHFGFVVYLESADWPLSASIAQVPDHMAELIFVEPAEPTPPTPTDGPDDTSPLETPETPSEIAETPPSPRVDRSTPAPMTAEEAIAAVNEASIGVAELIGASGLQGTIDDVLAGGAPAMSAEEVIGSVNGVEIAGVSDMPRIRDGSTGVYSTDIGGLRAITTRTGPVQEGDDLRADGPHLTTQIPEPDDLEPDGPGEFDQRVVVRMIQTRRAQITACYEHAILSDPTLRGRIEIQMTIEESGSVSRVRTLENGMGSDPVARCIENRVRAFRFNPGPTGGSVDFRFPFVFEQQR